MSLDPTRALLFDALVDAFTDRRDRYELEVRNERDERGRLTNRLELVVRVRGARLGEVAEARAVVNRGELEEFPHLHRDRTAAGDLRAYVDALEGHPNGARLGQIPNGRIPAFDEARDRGIVTPGGGFRRVGTGADVFRRLGGHSDR